MKSKAKIGKIIKESRLKHNLRMDDVAKEVGITRSTLWAIENGTGNYSIDILLKLVNYFNLSFEMESNKYHVNKQRATRLNKMIDKKINRFIIMCVEQYALKINKGSQYTYRILDNKGIIKELIDDYEDMHGMSTYSINEYIDKRLSLED